MKKKNTSKLIIKIGITFVIPFVMLIFGVLIILTTFWDVITYSMDIGKVIFNKPVVAIEEKQFEIHNAFMSRPAFGEAFATLKIPDLNFEEPVLHGDSVQELRKGIAHFAGSTLPGEGGNVIISGHRDRVFRPIENIEVGNEIIFETNYGSFKYKVSEIKIVNEQDNYELRVLDHERLTMYTCYPFTAIGNTSERMIIICNFIEAV